MNILLLLVKHGETDDECGEAKVNAAYGVAVVDGGGVRIEMSSDSSMVDAFLFMFAAAV